MPLPPFTTLLLSRLIQEPILYYTGVFLYKQVFALFYIYFEEKSRSGATTLHDAVQKLEEFLHMERDRGVINENYS